MFLRTVVSAAAQAFLQALGWELWSPRLEQGLVCSWESWGSGMRDPQDQDRPPGTARAQRGSLSVRVGGV